MTRQIRCLLAIALICVGCSHTDNKPLAIKATQSPTNADVQGGEIRVQRIRADGTVGTASVIAMTDISRSSGFPRMARRGNEVHFAWTDLGKPSRVRTAMTEINPTN